MAKTSPRRIKEFVDLVWEYYRRSGRVLPWRETRDPYPVLLSEIMLQQTQVDRVVPKYGQFLKKYPMIRSLASASLRDVLALWQGLGYNRRAKALREAARMVVDEFGGDVPTTREDLMRLPGVGHYTAGAIMAFAFDQPVEFIETNIRTVFIHHFFPDRDRVHDREILPLVVQTLDRDDPRHWYFALMDYGAHLKKTTGNPSRKSSHHHVQSRFRGSRRQVRGALIRVLTSEGHLTFDDLSDSLDIEASELRSILDDLVEEGMIGCAQAVFFIP